MTKLRIQLALYMFVLSAAVAVISGVVPVRIAGAGKHNLPAIQSNGAVTRTRYRNVEWRHPDLSERTVDELFIAANLVECLHFTSYTRALWAICL